MKSGSSEKKLGRFKKVFSDEEEAELLKFLQKLDDVFYGITRLEFLQLAGEFAKRKGKTGRFTEGVAGKGWYKNFMLRNPTVTLRTPEPTSLARVKSFNRVAVGRFYDLLEEKYFEIEVNVFQKAHPGRIINKFDVARLFSAAYLKGASQGNATSGFRASGIYPYNRHAISEEYFAPSEIYEFEHAEGDTQTMDTTADSNVQLHLKENADTSNDASILQNIRPLSVEVRKQIRQGRRKQKAEILTSTPIRNEQKRKSDAAAAKRKVFDDGPGPSKASKQPTPTPCGEENVQRDCFCTLCSEPYIDPPIENWIQCDTCRRWTHEACSSYLGRGAYYYDDCDD
nr:unnamed protein product [Callosobruchus chinensis]